MPTESSQLANCTELVIEHLLFTEAEATPTGWCFCFNDGSTAE